jgi:ubiquinol-cytochrome c reductase cytochrome b subunit
MVIGMMLVHLNLLHVRGRTGQSFTHRGVSKVGFFPYYWVKDLLNVSVYFVFLSLSVAFPFALGEVELFEESDRITSPVHIVPEWYFLAQYAILRRVPSKGAGVILMFLRIMILFLYPVTIGHVTPPTRLTPLVLIQGVFLQVWLSFLGSAPIRQPFILLSQLGVLVFFGAHALNMTINLLGVYLFNVKKVDSGRFWGRLLHRCQL